MDVIGVIGIVLAVLGLNALWNVPRQVRLHDRLIENRNENQKIWIDDVDRDLTTQLGRLTSKHASASGTNNEWPMYLRIWEKGQAKEEVVKRLTDQQRDAKQYRDQIELSEGWEHRVWRWIRSKPLPELMVWNGKADVIEEWHKPVTAEEVEKDEGRLQSIRKIAMRHRTPTGPFPPSGHR
jgi:hypothetical protein